MLLMAPRRSEECPDATTVWDTQVEEAAAVYVQTHTTTPEWAHLRRSVLLKVMTFGLDQYDMLLFADSDIDLYPPPAPSVNPELTARWLRGLADFNASSALFVASPDNAAPLNTGLFLLKPRGWLHRLALALLCNASWSRTDGFNQVGRPSTLGVDGRRRLAAGAGVSESRAARVINGTEMGRTDSWQFVAGDLDQGLFYYLLCLRLGVATWSHMGRVGAWQPEHFWGAGKPWTVSFASATYLRRVETVFGRRRDATRTRCSRHLMQLAGMLMQRGHWEVGSGRRPSIGRSSVLPAPGIRRFSPP